MHYVSALFDQVYGIDSYLNQDTWQECCKSLTRVLKALEDEPTIKLGAMSSDAIATIAQLAKTKPEAGNPEAGETAGKAQPAQDLTEDKVDEDGVLHVPGDVEGFVSRLSNHYTKALRKTDPHTYEYVNRLEDEAMLLDLARGAQEYYMRHNIHAKASQMAQTCMEHLYYKHDSVAAALSTAKALRLKFGAKRPGGTRMMRGMRASEARHCERG